MVLVAFALGACLATAANRTGRIPSDAPPPRDPAPDVPATDGADDASVDPGERVPIPAPPPPPPVAPQPPASAPQPGPARGAPPLVCVRLGGAGPSAAGTPVAVAGRWELRSPQGDLVAQGAKLAEKLHFEAERTRLGPHEIPRGGARLVPATAGDLVVGGRRYPGVLHVPGPAEGPTPKAGDARAVVEVDVETYLEGVVLGELPPDFPQEARRAQAVIARTYLLSQPNLDLASGVIPVDDSGLTDQEFVGIAGSRKTRDAAREAVRSTRGLVLWDGAKPLRAWYHSTCGGHTCPSAPVFRVPQTAPLGGVECTTCTSSPRYRWSAKLPGAKVVQAAGLKGALESLRALETTPTGRALTFEVRAGGKTAKVVASEFRLAVGPAELRSTWLDRADVTGGELSVSGRGWGHGVGLCQFGAKGLADRGATAEDIVRRYYPGAELRAAW